MSALRAHFSRGREKCRLERLKRHKRPIDFTFGRIMHKADSDDAPDVRETEAVDDRCRVKVAVPDEDALIAKFLRSGMWINPIQPDRKCGSSFVCVCRVGKTVQRRSGNLFETRKEALA